MDPKVTAIVAGPSSGAAVAQEQQHAAEGQEQVAVDQPHHPPGLLSLPYFLLHVVLDQLTSAADLAAAAASCSALRSLSHAAGTSWPRVASFAALRGWSPALPGSLRWAASRCPQLRLLDLAGAAACCDADLLPLSQLTSLTSLSLAGLWRVTGSSSDLSNRSHAGRHRGGPAMASQPLNVLAAILSSNCGLLALDLSSTAVPVGSTLAAALALLTVHAPNATKPAHGLQQLRLAGCRRAGGGGGQAEPAGALREVLLQCPALWRLDVSGCRWVTTEALPQSGEALALALTLLPLRHASFADCELLGGIGWLLSGWEGLLTLDLSGTAVDDSDVEQIAAGCHRLKSLNLSACVRIKGACLPALADSLAVQLGCLTELRLADLAWVQMHHLAPLLHALSVNGQSSSLLLDLSSCGGLADSSLLELLPAAAGQAGDVAGCCVQELRLAGSSRLTTPALLHLAAPTATGLGQHSLLRGLRELDVSHVQCLSSKSSKSSSVAAGADSSTSGTPATQALAALLTAAGGSLRRLSLDGCCTGDGLLPLLARSCPAVEQLSVVGCSGLADADLAVLSTLCQLHDLAVGGASLAWHEHRALTGLTGLTRLRIARRSFLTDAQLAPLLAANRGSLLQLELAGCASLTDQALLPLLPPQPVLAGNEQQQQQGQEHDRQQRLARPSLQHLQLVCCDRITGATLRQLGSLQSLRLGGCPTVAEAALQAAAVCCTRLTLLELPSHISPGRMPVAPAGAASHLRGIQLLGGTQEGGGRSSGAGRRGGRPRQRMA